MSYTDEVLQGLLAAPKVTRPVLSDVPTDQGAYVLWLEGAERVCLEVGIAGPRQGKERETATMPAHDSEGSTSYFLIFLVKTFPSRIVHECSHLGQKNMCSSRCSLVKIVLVDRQDGHGGGRGSAITM